MPRGSGAILVHQQLAANIPGYEVRPFDPRLELMAPLLSRFRSASATVVHATPDHGAMVVTRNQPLVVTFHNFVLDDEARTFSNVVQRIHHRTDLRWLTARSVKRATAITAVSAYTAGLVESFFELRQKVCVIENGIDMTMFSPAETASNGYVRVLVSGNASRRKGTHLLAKIARGLAPGIEMVCTLDKNELSRWGCDLPNVRALGKQAAAAMPSLYREADILLMPTAREGFGLAVAEAMASGLPVVAADTSTMPSLVSHENGGYLCSLDEPDQFSSRINALAAEPEVRVRMGEYNRRMAQKRFSFRAMIDNYRSLFEVVANT